MVLITAGVGFYAWKTSESAAAQADVQQAAASADGIERPEVGADSPSETRPESSDREARDAEPEKADAPEKKALAEKPAEKVAPATSAAKPTAAVTRKPVREKTPPKKDEPAKPAGSGSTVPVVDNEALPPTEWEF
jgi:hypothetical protein